MKIKKQKINGYIVLISFIIIGAIILIVALGISFISLNQKTAIISHNRSLRNYYLANACANYAILKLQSDLNYSGNETVALDQDNCRVESVTGSGKDRTIITSSQLGQQIKKLKIELEQIKPVTIIKTWGETFE
jgi:hypothetical protein